jgi:hypothetical protein
MANQTSGDDTRARGESRFEQQATANRGLLSEIFGFLGENKKWWLLPIIGTFLVIGLLVLLSTTAAAPFIYTFF